MMRCMILVLCGGVLLLTSCDRRHPTVRQTSTARTSDRKDVTETMPDASLKPAASHPTLSKLTKPATEQKRAAMTLPKGHGVAAARELITPDSKDVRLGKMRLVAPDDWKRVESRVRVVLAEFLLPRAEGDTTDARVTISASGGSVLESIERRRRKKVENPNDKSGQPLNIRGMDVDFEQIKIAGIDVTVIEFSPTSRTQPKTSPPLMMAPPGFQTKTAILPLSDQVYSIKCYGPVKTMNERDEEFDAFLRSMTPTEELP